MARDCLWRLQQRVLRARTRVESKRLFRVLSDAKDMELVRGLLTHHDRHVRTVTYRSMSLSGCDNQALPGLLALVAAEAHLPAALEGLECVALADNNGTHVEDLLGIADSINLESIVLQRYFRKRLSERRNQLVHDAITRRLEDWVSISENDEKFRLSVGTCEGKQRWLKQGNGEFGIFVEGDLCNYFEHEQPHFGHARSSISVADSITGWVNVLGRRIIILDADLSLDIETRPVPESVLKHSQPKKWNVHSARGRRKLLAKNLMQGGKKCSKTANDCCGLWVECETCSADDSSWTSALATCPCFLNFTCTNTRWCSCDTTSADIDCEDVSGAGQCFAKMHCGDSWNLDVDHLTRWHKAKHGAAICISRASVGGHLQRCCYDSSHQLITRGPAAGTPARFHPGRGGAKHLQWDFLSAVDCGLNSILNARYLERRPPSGQHCPANPARASQDPSATLLEKSFQLFLDLGAPSGENLERCSMQDSACKPFCVTGGISTKQCDVNTFSRAIHFDGVRISLSANIGHATSASSDSSLGTWLAKSGGQGARPLDQYREGGPIPEGSWWLYWIESKRSLEAFPCCGTQLLSRSACSSFSANTSMPCESAFSVFTTNDAARKQEGIHVHDANAELFFSEVRGRFDIVLVVDYSRTLTDFAVEIPSNYWKLKLPYDIYQSEGNVVSQEIIDSLRSRRGSICVDLYDIYEMFEDPDRPDNISTGQVCRLGPNRFQSCESDWDCRRCQKDSSCGAKDLQAQCIAQEDETSLEKIMRRDHENQEIMATENQNDGETTLLNLCEKVEPFTMSFFYGFFQIRFALGCGIEVGVQHSLLGCLTPTPGLFATLDPQVAFLARVQVSISLIVVRGGLQMDFRSALSMQGGAELNVPLEICPTISLSIDPASVSVNAFVEFGLLWFWCCKKEWSLFEWSHMQQQIDLFGECGRNRNNEPLPLLPPAPLTITEDQQLRAFLSVVDVDGDDLTIWLDQQALDPLQVTCSQNCTHYTYLFIYYKSLSFFSEVNKEDYDEH